MPDLQRLKAQVLADGIIEDQEVELICRELYADAKIDKQVVEFLIALREEALSICPTFEQFLYEAIKHHVLTDGSIKSEETAWLRQVLFVNGKIDEREMQLLWDLKHEASSVSREFQLLYDEYV
jgi:hypothetical protein